MKLCRIIFILKIDVKFDMRFWGRIVISFGEIQSHVWLRDGVTHIMILDNGFSRYIEGRIIANEIF
jgi:hypothetical protein